MFTTAWTASPQLPSEGFTPNWSREGFWRQSLRQVVRLTAGGDRLRVRLSHTYGTSPLRIAGATVARTREGAAVEADSVRRLTFEGPPMPRSRRAGSSSVTRSNSPWNPWSR